VFADAMLETAAAGTGLILDIDDDLFARQMHQQRTAIDLPLARSGRLGGHLAILLSRRFRRRDRLLQILERKRQLIGVKLLGAAAEAMPLQLLDDIRRLDVITGTGRRRRWSEDDKARIIEETLAPAAVVSQVARSHGL